MWISVHGSLQLARLFQEIHRQVLVPIQIFLSQRLSVAMQANKRMEATVQRTDSTTDVG